MRMVIVGWGAGAPPGADLSSHRSQRAERRAATARPPKARGLGAGLTPAQDTGREAVSSGSPQAPSSQPKLPRRPDTHRHYALAAPRLITREAGGSQITAAAARGCPEITAAPLHPAPPQNAVLSSAQEEGNQGTFPLPSRPRPRPEVTYGIAAILTPPPPLALWLLRGGGYRKGAQPGSRTVSPTPAGLWKGLEVTHGAGTGGRRRRGPVGPQGKGGHPERRWPPPQKGGPATEHPAIACCPGLGCPWTAGTLPSEASRAPASTTSPSAVSSPTSPAHRPFSSAVGSQTLLPQMCCTQLFARRLRSVLFFASNWATPPHPTPAASRTPLSQNPGSQRGVPSRGPRSVCPHKAPAHARGGQVPGWAWPRGGLWGCHTFFSLPRNRVCGSPSGGAQVLAGPGRAAGTWGGRPALGVSRSLLPGPTAQGGSGGREGAFQAGKGRSRFVPDVGRGLAPAPGKGRLKSRVPLLPRRPASPGGPGMEVLFLPLLLWFLGAGRPWLWRAPHAQPSASFNLAGRGWARPSPHASVLKASGQSSFWRLRAGCRGRNSNQEPVVGSAAHAILGASHRPEVPVLIHAGSRGCWPPPTPALR